MFAQAIRAAGIASVFDELLSFGGRELYVRPSGDLVGRPIVGSTVEIDGMTVLGVIDGESDTIELDPGTVSCGAIEVGLSADQVIPIGVVIDGESDTIELDPGTVSYGAIEVGLAADQVIPIGVVIDGVVTLHPSKSTSIEFGPDDRVVVVRRNRIRDVPVIIEAV